MPKTGGAGKAMAVEAEGREEFTRSGFRPRKKRRHRFADKVGVGSPPGRVRVDGRTRRLLRPTWSDGPGDAVAAFIRSDYPV